MSEDKDWYSISEAAKEEQIEAARDGFHEFVEEQRIELLETLARELQMDIAKVREVWRGC